MGESFYRDIFRGDLVAGSGEVRYFWRGFPWEASNGRETRDFLVARRENERR